MFYILNETFTNIDNYTHSHSPNINNQLLENSIIKTIAFYTHIGISCKRIHEHYKIYYNVWNLVLFYR